MGWLLFLAMEIKPWMSVTLLSQYYRTVEERWDTVSERGIHHDRDLTFKYQGVRARVQPTTKSR